MATVLQRESTEFIYSGVDGDVPSVGAEMAFLAAAVRPTSGDWEQAVLVPDNSHPLWADAVASGLLGDYYVAILVGAYGGTGVVLAPGDYQVWLRLTDTVEQPVRIAPTALEIA
ncbi:hypothetical protein [Acrocarpospora catenulata]|uniref:hypothetical protein n=1 Tax=Acrocarpospora catenulata TaxID=2836182 RepID=UPI001BDA15A4|nr:hypothetical protein [Acrocarpospora catenulata]